MNSRWAQRAGRALWVMVLTGAAAAQAVEVRGSLFCAAGADRDFRGLRPVDITFAIRCADDPFPGVSASSGSAVLVNGGAVEVQATSFAKIGVRGGVITASASAGAFFEVSTIVADTPPFMPDFLPVDLRISGHGSTTIGSTASAFLTDLFGHLLFSHEWAGHDPGSGFEDAEHLYIEPGSGIGLGKGVTCNSQAFLLGVPGDIPITDCFVGFDPVAVFDQAEFDRTWGAASFPLDRYFSLNLAPADPASVPEPSTALLLLAGVGALTRMSRRRGRAPAIATPSTRALRSPGPSASD